MKGAILTRLFIMTLIGFATTVLFQNCSASKMNFNTATLAQGKTNVGADGTATPVTSPNTSEGTPSATLPPAGDPSAVVPPSHSGGDVGFCHLVVKPCHGETKHHEDEDADSDVKQIGQHEHSEKIDSDEHESCDYQEEAHGQGDGDHHDSHGLSSAHMSAQASWKSTVRLIGEKGDAHDVCMSKEACSSVEGILTTSPVKLPKENEEDNSDKVGQAGQHEGEVEPKFTEILPQSADRCTFGALMMTDE
jgi:hypothetical protein